MPVPAHQRNKLNPQDQKNLIVFAIAFSILFLIFDMFLLRPHMEQFEEYARAKEAIEEERREMLDRGETPPAPPGPLSRREVLSESETSRITLSDEHVLGSVNLTGGRIDDLLLRNYFATLAQEEQISVLSPRGTAAPRHANVGWVAQARPGETAPLLPDADTPWQITDQNEGRLSLSWSNGQGLIFEREIELTDKFLIKVTQRVRNATGSDLSLMPFALISEYGLPENLHNMWIIHEGPIGFINEQLEERDYSDMPPQETIGAQEGWVGFTEHYWLTAILPDQSGSKTFRFVRDDPPAPSPDEELIPGLVQPETRWQVDVLSPSITIAQGDEIEHVTHFFLGAKELRLLEKYSKELAIERVDAAIDFGWFWFMTRPFFQAMLFINDFTGHFGLTILVFAAVLRCAVFPLANTSFRSFAKMRVVAPRIKELQEEYKDDPTALRAEIFELYKKEKINPASGCLPILIQIPIFFSLFKVLNVAIEMRHASGFFWIDDLSAPDPTSLFNLFGALPYDVPQFLVIGAWPCLMFVTLIIQKSMNPPPTDPLQRDMFRILPYVMTFIMAGFAAGLVIYWTFNNVLSMIQQYVIMKRMGVEVKFFQGWFGREPVTDPLAGSNIGSTSDALEHKVEKALGDLAEGGHSSPEEPQEITPPKRKRKAKKK